MTEKQVNGYTISVLESDRLGSAWVVRVTRRRFPFRKTVSSDWFLDRDQAMRFADEAAAELSRDQGVRTLLSRRAGWTLRRPPR